MVTGSPNFDILSPPKRSALSTFISVFGHASIIVTLLLLPLFTDLMRPPLVPPRQIVPVFTLSASSKALARRPEAEESADSIPSVTKPAVTAPLPVVRSAGFDFEEAVATDHTASGRIVIGTWAASSMTDGPYKTGAVGPTDLFGLSHADIESTTDKPAHLIWTGTPIYSDEALASRISGRVILRVKLMATGEVRSLEVVSGLGFGLDAAAIKAVNASRCEPAIKAGQPIDVIATITVVFKLT